MMKCETADSHMTVVSEVFTLLTCHDFGIGNACLCLYNYSLNHTAEQYNKTAAYVT